MKKLAIAIDGPAGAGKSTVAQIVAERLQYVYIDTGAMYRAVTWKALQNGLTASDTEKIIKISQAIQIKLININSKKTILVDGQDVTTEIRTPEVTAFVSTVSQLPDVRKAMTGLQKSMAKEGGIVMDGRDIGTHVLPDAEVKVFLVASIEERAKRRWLELKEKKYDVELEEVKAEIIARDEMDCKREMAPLIQAPDAVLIDTTALSIEGTVLAILKLCEGKNRDL